jgi:integrase/recombinase XerD
METTINIAEVQEYLDTLRLDKSKNTLSVYTIAINKLFNFMNVKTFDDVKNITSANLRSHQNDLKQKGLQPSSINTNMRPIRAMFHWFVENEYMEKSPMEKVKDVKMPKKEVAVLSVEEIDSMVKACKNDLDRLIFVLYITTGLRREELATLKLSDYDGTHIYPLRKGNEKQSLILQPEVADLLNSYLEKRKKKYPNTDYLIVSKMGSRFSGTAIYMKIKTIATLAGLSEDRVKQIHVHTTRHSFVANLQDSGADAYVIQRALNHKDIKTTMRYMHLRQSALDNAMLKQKSII